MFKSCWKKIRIEIKPILIMKGNQLRHFLKYILPAFWVLAFSLASQAQSKVVDKANELFKYNQFADAAALYQQAIGELEASGKSGRGMLNLKTKLAYCYRMNNKTNLAEALYAEVVQDEKTKSDNYFYYAEALMSNGKYAEAKKWFADYLVLEPEDEKAKLMIESCDQAPSIQPYFQNIDIQEFAHNSPADDNAPLLWQGGILFSSDRQTGVKLLKEKSGWTGRDYLDLYFSEKRQDGMFGEPKQFSSKLSEVNKNTGNASITADGSEIYFTRNDNVLNKQNAYSLQLFQATSTGNDRWKSVDKLSFCSPNYNFMHPAISPDGQTLYFVTNKAGGEGGTDIWVAQRKGGDWERPENLGPVVNTPFNEGFPFVDAEGRLYFCSKGHPGFGGFDIFVTEKDADGNWATPRNLGKPINSSLDDISIYLAPDQRSGMFTSSRNGGDDDIYLFTVLGEAPAVETIVLTQKIDVAPMEEMNMQEKGGSEKTEPTPEEKIEEIAPQPVEKEEFNEKNTLPATPAQKEKIEIIRENNSPEILPEVEEKILPPGEISAPKELASFTGFIQKLETETLIAGERFRLDNAVFDPNIWQLTPRVSTMLDKLADLLRQYPSLKIELSAHTETLGIDRENLELSQNRVQIALDYLVKEGISEDRIAIKACGETMPLNHCKNDVPCSTEEHQFNQRLEIKVLSLNGKW